MLAAPTWAASGQLGASEPSDGADYDRGGRVVNDLGTTLARSCVLTFALSLLSGNACGSHDRRPHAARADLRQRGACARRSRGWVEYRDVLVLAQRAGLEQGRRPPRTRRRELGGQVQLAQNALDHRRLFDQRDQPEAPATAGTGQDVNTKRPAHQVRPAPCLVAERSPPPLQGRIGRRFGGAGLAGGDVLSGRGRVGGPELAEISALCGSGRVGSAGLAAIGGVPKTHDEGPPRCPWPETPSSRNWSSTGTAPQGRGRLPARGPSANVPCTDAPAMPASAGASSVHSSSAPAHSSPSPRPRRSSRRLTRGTIVASTSATSAVVSNGAGQKRVSAPSLDANCHSLPAVTTAHACRLVAQAVPAVDVGAVVRALLGRAPVDRRGLLGRSSVRPASDSGGSVHMPSGTRAETPVSASFRPSSP